MKVIPNTLSIFRICLVPVFVLAYFWDPSEIKIYAIVIFGVAGLSDFFDGFLARTFNAQSRLGKILDPLGDKMMIFTVLICLTITYKILFWAVIVFFVKEIMMGIGGYIIHKIAQIEMPPAIFIGKASNVIFFLVCAALMMFGSFMSDTVKIILIAFAICLALVALAVYIRRYFKIMNSRPEKQKCNHQSVPDANETPQ